MVQAPTGRRWDARVERLMGALALYRTITVVLLAVVICETGVILWQSRHARFARAIRINNQIACYVRNEKAADQVLNRLLQELKGNLPGSAVLEQKWESLNWPLEKNARVLSVDEAVALLKPKVTVKVSAAAIQLGNQPLVYLPTRELAQMALDALRNKYSQGPGKLISVEILQKNVTVAEVKTRPSNVITDVHEAVRRLTAERDMARKYVVRRGDSWRKIADEHKMTVAELKRLNPKIGPIIHVGDELTVSSPAPPLTVVTVREETREEEYTAKPERVPVETMPEGETRVTIQAVPGKVLYTDRVTYHNGRRVSATNIRKTIIQEAQPERILVGTAPKPPA